METATVGNQEAELKLKEMDQSMHPLIQKAEGLIVKDAASFGEANFFLVQLAQERKRIEQMRAYFCDPIYQGWKRLSDAFKARLQPIEMAEKKVDRAAKDWKLAEDRKAEELARKQAEESEKARKKAEAKGKEYTPPPVMAPAPMPKTHYTPEGKVTYVEVWKSEVVNAKEVPDKFKVPDPRLIQRAVDDGVREISGVKIWKDLQSRKG